ncbi:hypothetical protein [Deinococcus pimensis]|uniref:hypothetical protein n=1 Tax=Deinococcus pimensis TaxID=309888 RepID=UPI0004B07D0E|nr:hypothetical protein [Deinococcus pimensis]
MKKLTALVVAMTAATTALAMPADAVDVYISNNAGQAGLIDVYVDGVRTASRLFPGTSTMFPVKLAAGRHAVIVTSANANGMGSTIFSADVTITRNQERAHLVLGTNDKNDLKLNVKTYSLSF